MKTSRMVGRAFVATLMIGLSASFAQAIPGLYEARYSGRQVYSSTYSENTKDRVVLGPYGANAKNNNVVLNANDSSITNWPSSSGGWGDNITFYYAGYIYIPAGSNTVTFAASFDDSKRLCIDGDELFRTTSHTDNTYATCTLSTGWHKFDFWIDNGTGGYGPTGWGSSDIGFGIDWSGRDALTRDNFVFPEDPGDGSLFSADRPAGYVEVTAYAPTSVGETSADVSATVALDDGLVSGTLRVYYGDSDLGKTTEGWAGFADYPGAIGVSGTYEVTLTGLTTDLPYHYRVCFVTGGGEYFAQDSFSFTPQGYNSPSRFLLISPNSAVDWDDAAAWQNLDAMPRAVPGVAGDYVNATNTVTLSLTRSVAFKEFAHTPVSGSMTLVAGAESAPFTVAFDATPENMSYLRLRQEGTMRFGVSQDTVMMLELRNPITIQQTGGDKRGHVFLNAPLSGGTEDEPYDITVIGSNNEWGRWVVAFANAENTFRGDIYCGGGHNNEQYRVFMGYTGNGEDSMFGHPDNKIILNGGKGSLCVSPSATSALNRRVLGRGSIKGTTISPEWGTEDARALRLGPNASLEPSNGTGVGTISLHGSSITTDPETTAVLDLTATANDMISISSSSASVEWTGRIELVADSEDIAIGTSWIIMKMAALKDKTFAFNPSFVTEGYSTKVSGNATDGWSVTATKLDPDAGAVVQNLPVDLIGETQATVIAEVVSLGVSGTATLRAYYGETDGESNPAAWANCAEYSAPVSELGQYSRVIDTRIEVGKTYYVRHSLSNNVGEYMSVDVVEFTAMPHTTPDTFTWAVTNGEWFAEGAWTTDTPYLRKTPQFIGDKIVVNVKGVYSTPGVNRNINITNDVTLSEMTISEGYERSAVFTATNTPANLTFDSLGDMSYIRISSQLRHLYLGNSDTNNNLSITLNKPLIITRGSAWAVEIHTYAALSGGSATSPSDIVLDVTGDQYCQLYMYLFNTNNTFRGDVYVGNTGNNSSTSELRAGSSANLANDKQFGHSDNKIILRQNSTLTLFGPSATPAEFARNLHGNGTFATSGAGGVALTESAKLRPHAKTGEDGFGTITIRAESFADVAKTQYEFKIADDDTSMADKLVFDVTGDVSVTGKINIIPASKYTPIGESWEIMTINKQETTSFSHKLKGVPHPLNTSMCFRFYVEEKENGWVVKAQSECPTVLIVK